MRVGIGYDVHRLVDGRPLILGGVQIPSDVGLAGHSDADVLLHAITDALLGAAALGDIGVHFPDTDDAYEGADSVELLISAARLVREAGYGVVNVDAVVVLEAPKLKPYVGAMREKIAEALGIEVGAVSVKATTSERIGFVGREEGASAQAICLLGQL